LSELEGPDINHASTKDWWNEGPDINHASTKDWWNEGPDGSPSGSSHSPNTTAPILVYWLILIRLPANYVKSTSLVSVT